jgi:hypothetical protein
MPPVSVGNLPVPGIENITEAVVPYAASKTMLSQGYEPLAIICLAPGQSHASNAMTS